MNVISKLRFVSAFMLLCALAIGSLQAQVQNCGLPAGAGGTLGITGGATPLGSLSPDPMRTGESSGLDLVEYLFFNPNSILTDTFGTDVFISGQEIIGANATGQIDPADLGLSDGDEFCVQSFSFTLAELQDQIDTLFVGEFLGLTCCEFAEFVQEVDVCSLLTNAGIIEGSDVTNADEVVDFAINYGINPTLESLFTLIDSVINIVPDGAGCITAGDMCYATSNKVCFTVGEGLFTEPVIGQEWIGALQSGPNPTIDNWSVRFETQWTGQADVLVTDLTGQVISREAVNVIAGSNYIPVDMSSLATGQYLISVIASDWTIRAKTIKQ